MEFEQTEMPAVILIKPTLIEDHPGFFMESYHIEKFNMGGIDCTFVQDNHVKSVKNILRGLHFQVEYAQGKLLRCLQGKVFDVAVDSRKNSHYYGKWVAEILSDAIKYQLIIPKGFALGYYVMYETAEIAYKCSDIYHPKDEKGIIWNDPEIGIDCPGLNPIFSVRDQNLTLLKDLHDSPAI